MEKDVFKHKYQQKGDGKLELEVYTNSNLVIRFPIQIVKEKGIYQACHNSMQAFYSFDTTISTFPCKGILPYFSTKSIKYFAKRNYIINSKKYIVWCFVETGEYDRVFFTYYAENIGFICFCDISEGDYFICNKIDGNKMGIENIKDLNKAIISDKTFFGNFIIKKEKINFVCPEKIY